MNNETVSNLSIETYINAVYFANVQVYAAFGSLTLLTYASILHFPDEVEYIWGRKFTLTTFLYSFCQYSTLLFFSVFLVGQLLPESLRLCNELGVLIQVIATFPFIGLQGLISLRTFSLCQGYLPMSIALVATLLTAFIIQIYGIIVPYCGTTSSLYIKDSVIFGLIHNIAILLSDILAFIGATHQVWRLWRLKRSLGLQSNEDVVTSILRQGFLRFCFVLLITPTGILLLIVSPSKGASSFISFQNVLSSLLICEFTLDLRRRNTPRSVTNPSAMDLPTLSFRENPGQSVRSVLGRFHESIVDEMGERDDPIDIDDNVNSEDLNDHQNDPNGMNSDFREDQARGV